MSHYIYFDKSGNRLYPSLEGDHFNHIDLIFENVSINLFETHQIHIFEEVYVRDSNLGLVSNSDESTCFCQVSTDGGKTGFIPLDIKILQLLNQRELEIPIILNPTPLREINSLIFGVSSTENINLNKSKVDSLLSFNVTSVFNDDLGDWMYSMTPNGRHYLSNWFSQNEESIFKKLGYRKELIRPRGLSNRDSDFSRLKFELVSGSDAISIFTINENHTDFKKSRQYFPFEDDNSNVESLPTIKMWYSSMIDDRLENSEWESLSNEFVFATPFDSDTTVDDDNLFPNYNRHYLTPIRRVILDEGVEIDKSPITINFCLSSLQEGIHHLNLKTSVEHYLLDKKSEFYNVDSELLLNIDFEGEVIGEDERFVNLLENFGRNIDEDDFFVIKDYDLNDDELDYIRINDKRKELLLHGEEIFPFVGSYKSIKNALKWLDYQDIEIREYFYNIQTWNPDENKIEYKIFSPNGERNKNWLVEGEKKFINYKDVIFPKLSADWKKTTRMGLVWSYNEYTGTFDEEGIPIIRNKNDFSPEEAMIKLYGIKKVLYKYFLPHNARIVNIGLEGIYFAKAQLVAWNEVSRIVHERKVPHFKIKSLSEREFPSLVSIFELIGEFWEKDQMDGFLNKRINQICEKKISEIGDATKSRPIKSLYSRVAQEGGGIPQQIFDFIRNSPKWIPFLENPTFDEFLVEIADFWNLFEEGRSLFENLALFLVECEEDEMTWKDFDNLRWLDFRPFLWNFKDKSEMESIFPNWNNSHEGDRGNYVINGRTANSNIPTTPSLWTKETESWVESVGYPSVVWRWDSFSISPTTPIRWTVSQKKSKTETGNRFLEVDKSKKDLTWTYKVDSIEKEGIPVRRSKVQRGEFRDLKQLLIPVFDRGTFDVSCSIIDDYGNPLSVIEGDFLKVGERELDLIGIDTFRKQIHINEKKNLGWNDLQFSQFLNQDFLFPFGNQSFSEFPMTFLEIKGIRDGKIKFDNSLPNFSAIREKFNSSMKNYRNVHFYKSYTTKNGIPQVFDENTDFRVRSYGTYTVDASGGLIDGFPRLLDSTLRVKTFETMVDPNTSEDIFVPPTTKYFSGVGGDFDNLSHYLHFDWFSTMKKKYGDPYETTPFHFKGFSTMKRAFFAGNQQKSEHPNFFEILEVGIQFLKLKIHFPTKPEWFYHFAQKLKRDSTFELRRNSGTKKTTLFDFRIEKVEIDFANNFIILDSTLDGNIWNCEQIKKWNSTDPSFFKRDSQFVFYFDEITLPFDWIFPNEEYHEYYNEASLVHFTLPQQQLSSYFDNSPLRDFPTFLTMNTDSGLVSDKVKHSKPPFLNEEGFLLNISPETLCRLSFDHLLTFANFDWFEFNKRAKFDSLDWENLFDSHSLKESNFTFKDFNFKSMDFSLKDLDSSFVEIPFRIPVSSPMIFSPTNKEDWKFFKWEIYSGWTDSNILLGESYRPYITYFFDKAGYYLIKLNASTDFGIGKTIEKTFKLIVE